MFVMVDKIEWRFCKKIIRLSVYEDLI